MGFKPLPVVAGVQYDAPVKSIRLGKLNLCSEDYMPE